MGHLYMQHRSLIDVIFDKVSTPEKDLLFVAEWFPSGSLLHVLQNSHRLVRRYYTLDGKGCPFYLLSEPLRTQILDRTDLTKYFVGKSGDPAREAAHYQPARYLVRIIDGVSCPRYDGKSSLAWSVVLRTLEESLSLRRLHEREGLFEEFAWGEKDFGSVTSGWCDCAEQQTAQVGTELQIDLALNNS